MFVDEILDRLEQLCQLLHLLVVIVARFVVCIELKALTDLTVTSNNGPKSM